MASSPSLVTFMKNLALILVSSFIFIACSQNIFSQTENSNRKKPVAKTKVSPFYQTEMLKSDYEQSAIVAYVDITERNLVNFIGSGDCESRKGKGYCLYRLKANVKQVYKGEIAGKTIEFYVSPDADYAKKHLMGEKVVFLNWSETGNDGKRNLSAMENSMRSIENDVLKKMSKIAARRN
jgi:hypothetical protein